MISERKMTCLQRAPSHPAVTGGECTPAIRRPLLCLALAAAFPASAATDLTSLSLEQLLEVNVVGASKYEQKQSEVAAAVSVITRQEIAAFGWRTLDEALASLPGIYTSYDRQYTLLGTRGFGLPGDLNMRVLFTINGNRVNDPIYDGGPAGREFPLDMDLIERIEFIPGPGGAVYGQNAMFGVVNVITRTGADVDGLAVKLAYQDPQAGRTGRASWGAQLDNGVDVLISVSGMRARGDDLYFDYGSTGVSGVATGLDGERDQEFFGRIARDRWSFEFTHGDRRKDDPAAADFSDPLVPGQFSRDSYALAQLQYEESFAGDTLHLSARLFTGAYRFRGVLSYGTQVSSPAEGDWHGTEWRLVSTAAASHKLMLGIEAQDNVRIDQAALDLANPANDIRVRNSGYRIGLYGQDEWHISEALTATLGLRIDRNDATGTHLSPRAALIWQATPASSLKALFGRAHRAPNAYERDFGDNLYQVPNPALNGEQIDTVELVSDHRVGSDLTLRGSVYQWRMRDIVTLGIDPVSGLTQYQSGETVRARGVELSADKTWGSGTRLRGSVSLQNVDDASGSKLLNSPDALGKLNLSGPLPWAGLYVGYELRYDSKRLSLDSSGLGGYTLSNLYLGTDALAKGLELSLGIYNMFDKRYAHPGADFNWQNALQQDGRSIRVTLGYNF
jgi:iron complex outermembrane receptor protein